MRFLLPAVSTVAAFTLMAPVAIATTTWDERSAITAFLAESPEVTAARQAIAVAQAEVAAAEVWANPALETSREQIFSSGGPTEQNRVGVAVPLSVPGKRGLRKAIAEAGVAAAEARATERVAELLAAFRHTYAQACFAEARAKHLTTGLEAYRRLGTTLDRRRRAGETAGYDVLRLKLQVTSLEARLADTRATARQARGQLAAYLGHPVEDDLNLAPLADLPDTEALVATALARRPELARLRAERRQAELSLELADRQAWPDPQVSVGVRQTNEPTVQGLGYAAGLNWPMPIFDRGQAARARAEADTARLAAETRALETRLRAEVAASRQALLDRRAALAAFKADVMPHAPAVLKVAELAYQEGESDIGPLLDAHEASTQTRLQHLEMAEAVHEAMIELDMRTGQLLPAPQGEH